MFVLFSSKDFRKLVGKIENFKETFEEIEFFENEEQKVEKNKISQFCKI